MKPSKRVSIKISRPSEGWIYTFACFWLPIIAATFILFFALDQMFVNY